MPRLQIVDEEIMQYYLYENSREGYTVEVSEQFYERYQKTVKAMSEMQEQLAAIYDDAMKNRKVWQ